MGYTPKQYNLHVYSCAKYSPKIFLTQSNELNLKITLNACMY